MRALTPIEVIFAVLVLVAACLVYAHWSRRVVYRDGILLQISLPKEDGTPPGAVLQTLALLHDIGQHYSFELASDTEGFRVLLWTTTEPFQSREAAAAAVEQCVRASFKDAVVEPCAEPRMEPVLAAVEEQKPYWYSLKGLERFGGAEPLDVWSSMLTGRLQILAKPEYGWRHMVENHLLSVSSGAESAGLLGDVLRAFARAFVRDPKAVDRVLGGDGGSPTPLEKAIVTAGWSSLDRPAYSCEVRLLAPNALALKKALSTLKLYDQPGANHFVRSLDPPKLEELIRARSFTRRHLRDKRKTILPVDVLAALWHPPGSAAAGENVVRARSRTLPAPQDVPLLEVSTAAVRGGGGDGGG